MRAQITIVDDSGTVQPPPDVEIADGKTVFLRNQASKNATLHFSGDKVLFHHGVQVDQQATRQRKRQRNVVKSKKRTTEK